jgi:hypothetical protein
MYEPFLHAGSSSNRQEPLSRQRVQRPRMQTSSRFGQTRWPPRRGPISTQRSWPPWHCQEELTHGLSLHSPLFLQGRQLPLKHAFCPPQLVPFDRLETLQLSTPPMHWYWLVLQASSPLQLPVVRHCTQAPPRQAFSLPHPEPSGLLLQRPMLQV